MSIKYNSKSTTQKPVYPFVGKRIYLRKLTAQDATPKYCGWLNDPTINRFLATKQCTIPELKAYIVARNKQPSALFYGIFLKKTNQHIGTIKLQDIGTRNDIAILIGDKQCWGKGFAGEAMQLLINYCFNTLGLKKVTLGVLAQNVSALRAYTKLGFKEIKREYGLVKHGAETFDQVSMILEKP